MSEDCLSQQASQESEQAQQASQESEQPYQTSQAAEQPKPMTQRAGTPLVTLDHVGVRYNTGSRPVLQDLSFTLSAGETVLLAGPSGSGKSTLALLCAGLIPESVEADVEGHVARHREIVAPGGTAMVFQDPTTQFCMPQVADEIAFGLENQNRRPDSMPRSIAQSMQQTTLGIGPEREHQQLSGGQQQKLAIAAALAMSPQLLILDEPTSNLDPESTQLVFDEIAKLHQRGQTMLIVEHKFRPLLDVVDRIVLFDRHGRIHCVGPTAEVVEQQWSWMIQHGVVREDFDRNAKHAQSATNSSDDAMGSSEDAIVVRGARMSYGDQPVWADLDVAIPQGRLTTIVGPNGVGKSTLLQAMCGLQSLAEGEVDILSRPMSQWKRAQRLRAVTYCFQNPEFQFVYERVADEFVNEHIPGEVPPDVEDRLEEFGLGGTAEQSPFELSQGQKRRLSVAVMLHDDHDIYLLDEPTYGQDAKTERAIMGLMEDLVASGKTVVLTTHDMRLVNQYADHVIALADGSCVFAGNPIELFADPVLLAKAHLTEPHAPDLFGPASSPVVQRLRESRGGLESRIQSMQKQKSVHPTGRLNPAWLTLALVVAGLIGTFSWNFTQAIVAFVVSLIWVFGVARVRLRFALKWYAWFVLIYIFYIWSFSAYAAVPLGASHFRVGWMNFSWYGLEQGILVAVRMFSSVGYLIVLTGTVSLTNLIVALSKNMRVPPKFAFGILAGLRLAPLLQSEWGQLKLARQLRGKDARFAMTRPVRYAIPLLSQGVRMSERVAVAMEARGLLGEAASKASGRTYFREMSVHTVDVVVAITAVLIPVAILVFLH